MLQGPQGRARELTPQQLAAALKRRALEAGAQLAGLAPAAALPESAAYDAWVAQGRHAAMSYMARNQEARRDIRAWYPEARSVLMCAFGYAQNGDSPPRAGMGRLARYAVLPDYHVELRRRLDGVLDWLRAAAPGSDGRAFVDTSPLLERLYGRYAGLGWVGRSTLLISPKLGSYFFLAGAALNVELPADEPASDRCGSCRRCIEACPTQAFPEDRVLDANKCISYWTIEHKGAVAPGIREGLQDWVLGCDVCQEVCPWNRFARPSDAFPPPGETSLPLEELASLDAAAFKKRFGDTPLARAKRRGIVRNALLAMGNSGDARHAPALERFLHDEDEVLREQAEWSLARLKGRPAN